jgi:uncharacterized protein YciI
MKTAVSSLIVAVLALVGAVSAQSPRYPAPEKMQTVHVALLYRGPNATSGPATPEQQALQAAHVAHLTKLGNEGHAYIAGPMGGTGDLRGLVFLKAESADAARALEAEDPAVKAGRLRIEMVSYMSPGNWFTFGPITPDLKMRQFVYGYLKVGPNQGGTAAEQAKAQDDHLANLWAMRESGALVAAGPIVNGGDRAGVVVLAVNTIDEAKALLEQDAGVKSGRFTLELYPWFAAGGILKGK